LSSLQDLDSNTRGYWARSAITLLIRSKANHEYQELKAARPYALPILRGSDDSDSKDELEFITAIPTLNSEEDAHYVVACESYMEEEAQNLEEW
jgi:hypothetical protein